MAYRFIDDDKDFFGVRWLLHRLDIDPNAYYNDRKHRKAACREEKQRIKKQIEEIYHKHNGVDGYRMMQADPERAGIVLSPLTVHKYMNTELEILSVTRRKRPEYHKGKAHKVFPNILEQDFDSNEIHTKWCTDFTCLFLENGEKRYNCSIVDLHDRSVIASITDRHMTADPAVRTIRKAIESQPEIKGVLILHSDQGSQYTSNEFVEYCERMRVTQSMSKAGYPYDNAPMERYFNTLKNDLIHEHSCKTEDELYRSIEEYAYATYNHARPYSYNGYKTPFEARCIA